MKKYKVVDNVFYCAAKRCRKTAWDTPEYMSDDDWKFLSGVVALLESGDSGAAFDFVWGDSTKANSFFNHIIGWPEGLNYTHGNLEYWTQTAFPGFVKHSLPKMKLAIETHLG